MYANLLILTEATIGFCTDRQPARPLPTAESLTTVLSPVVFVEVILPRKLLRTRSTNKTFSGGFTEMTLHMVPHVAFLCHTHRTFQAFHWLEMVLKMLPIDVQMKFFSPHRSRLACIPSVSGISWSKPDLRGADVTSDICICSRCLCFRRMGSMEAILLQYTGSITNCSRMSCCLVRPLEFQQKNGHYCLRYRGSRMKGTKNKHDLLSWVGEGAHSTECGRHH